MDVYECCPVLRNNSFLLRQTEKGDCSDLFRVYSDPAAVPLFNSDNCNGDDFFYRTMERMAEAIDFWSFSYRNRYFVRWSVIDRATNEAVGTIELFHRKAEDAFNDTGLLRLDLRSDYERPEMIGSILSLILRSAPDLFGCDSITTKAPVQAVIRRDVLRQMGFEESDDTLIGHDGASYKDYFVKTYE